ncbi:MAG: prepilin-type N-terminal cleavage/methylation domain-containing protein, partial [Chthoniobacterales bacterium]|nr:prepilin-type N-terminal cleavage/methylation domain-containing protein [Chthoniobacterales bacterium]
MKEFQTISFRIKIAAFTLPELLVTLAIAAAVITAALIGFSSFSKAREAIDQRTYLQIGSFATTYYGMPANATFETRSAPSPQRRFMAEQFREALYDDLYQSVAAFILARPNNTPIRPSSVNLTWSDASPFSTPNDFRSVLVNNGVSNVPAFNFNSTSLSYLQTANGPNLSLFFLSPRNSPTGPLRIRAIYELDFLPISNPQGTYASLRRMAFDSSANAWTLSAYYDVFYPTPPLSSNSTAITNFQPVAAYFQPTQDAQFPQPFYFLWLPDPGVFPLQPTI